MSCRFEEALRSRGTEAQEPDECRNRDGMVWGAVPEHGQRVHHGHVAMHCHDCEKEKAAVVTQIEDEVYRFAGDVSEHPTRDEIDGPEGQAKGKDEVRDGQVQEESVGQGF